MENPEIEAFSAIQKYEDVLCRFVVNPLVRCQTMVKIEIDQDLCIGDEICASTEPEIYEMRDDGFAYVVEGMEEVDDEALIEAARDAEAACPVDAITVSE